MKKVFLFIFLLWNCYSSVWAMNIRSLEISYEHINDTKYKFEVVAYTFAASPVDSSLSISWGDLDTGTVELVYITYLGNDIKKCIYSGTHFYSGPYTYIVSVEYYSHSCNIQNIPESDEVSFYAETILKINEINNSPVFQNPPVENICKDHFYLYNPDAYDIDGDSLSYRLTECRGIGGETIQGYFYPDASNVFFMDSITGDLIWDSPLQPGIYGIAFIVEEWRDGVKIGSVTRDMELIVLSCTGTFPVIETISDTCVDAGSFFEFDINAFLPGADSLTLYGYGEPLNLVLSPAQFIQPLTGTDSVNSQFTWQILCSHIRKEPYRIYFKAADFSPCTGGQQEMLTDFNSSILEDGWVSENIPFFNDPCTISSDDSPYLWMGNNSAAPRVLESPFFDLTNSVNNNICFDMMYAEHHGFPGTTCEGPDLPGEGVHFQYSTDESSNIWIEAEYWDPAIPEPGGHNPGLIEWRTYCFSLEDNVVSDNIKFRWMQVLCDGNDFDHWGLDNIRLYNIPENHVDYKAVDIKVVCPAPENLNAVAFGDHISLTWNECICDNAAGYKIYRKGSFYGFEPANCETGVPEYTGYMEIADIPYINTTTFTDNNNGQGLCQGIEYCYMVIAYFSNGSESYASNEACAELPQTAPVITNVSIEETGINNGSVYIAWTKPLILDTVIYPGPYKYIIYRSEDFFGNNFVNVDTLYGLDDTVYTDISVNTRDQPISYKTELYNNMLLIDNLIGSSEVASSVYLTVTPSDNRADLFWEEHVPWTNNYYTVLRQNQITLQFDTLAVTNEHFYSDTELVNEETYCYKIESNGSYSGEYFTDELINLSQEKCETVQDLTIPCCPEILSLSTDCDLFENYLVWNDPNNFCADDVIQYNIYYSNTSVNNMEIIASTFSHQDTSYIHIPTETIAGYYIVTAIDSFLNESIDCDIVSIDIDSCMSYVLPNVFTPGNDGFNDLFVPGPYNFVERVEMTIFNRWGNIVFITEDPDIRWDGRNIYNNELCTTGVYFYICDVYEKHLTGVEKRTLTGFIHLFRSSDQKQY